MTDPMDRVSAVTGSAMTTAKRPPQASLPIPRLGTKAQTLARLAGGSASFRVPPLLAFSAARWATEPEAILAAIASRFGDQSLAVRSSARSEDSAAASQAGAFASRLWKTGADHVFCAGRSTRQARHP